MSTFADYLPKFGDFKNEDYQNHLEFIFKFQSIHDEQKGKDLQNLQLQQEIELTYLQKRKEIEIETEQRIADIKIKQAQTLAEIEINKAKTLNELYNNTHQAPQVTGQIESVVEVEQEVEEVKWGGSIFEEGFKFNKPQNKAQKVVTVKINKEEEQETKVTKVKLSEALEAKLNHLQYEATFEELRFQDEQTLRTVYIKCFGKNFRANSAEKTIINKRSLLATKILEWRKDYKEFNVFSDAEDIPVIDDCNTSLLEKVELATKIYEEEMEYQQEKENRAGAIILRKGDKRKRFFIFPNNEYVDYKEDLSSKDLNLFLLNELGLSGEVTKESLLKSKKEAILKYHPDKFPNPEEKKFNEEKSQQINQVVDDLEFLFFGELDASDECDLRIMSSLARLSKFESIKDNIKIEKTEKPKHNKQKRSKRAPWWVVLDIDKSYPLLNKDYIEEKWDKAMREAETNGYSDYVVNKAYDQAIQYNFEAKFKLA